jgi:uncharacterized RDD family membrane protein YckC
MSADNTQLDLTHWVYRLIAYIIDIIIIAIPSFIIAFVLLLVAFLSGGFFGGIAFLGYLILGVLSFLYFLFLDVTWGGTVGKRVMGLRVQKVNGGKITFGQSFIRNITKIFGLFLLLDWLLGVIMAGDKRQKFTDRAAGTVVVVSKQSMMVPPPPPPPPA